MPHYFTNDTSIETILRDIGVPIPIPIPVPIPIPIQLQVVQRSVHVDT